MSEKEETEKTQASSDKDGTGDKNAIPLPIDDTKENASRPMLPSHEPSQLSQQVREYCIQRLLDGVSYRVLSEELNGQISKTTLWRLFPKEYIETIRKELTAQQQQTELQAPSSSIPSAHVIVPLEWLVDYEKTLPVAQRRVHEQMRGNIIRYNQQLDREAKQYQAKPSSNPSAYGSGYDQLCRELAESEKVERVMRLRQGLKGGSGNNGVEQILKAIQIGVQLVPKGQNVDTVGIYRTGRQDQKTEVGKSGETNIVDLKLEEMRQSHDIGMEKLSWEQKLYFLKLENDKDKWEKIQDTFAPILQQATPEIRNALKQLGEGVGRSLGANPNPNPDAKTELTSVQCPKCASSLNVNIPEGLQQINVKCPKCQNLFKIGKEAEGSSEIRPKARLTYKDS